MARAEELADLFSFAGKFGPGGSPDTKGPVGFHQGQILTWDANTGRNSVRVLGTTVNDLPMLTTTDSTMLVEGDTVGILRFRQTYFILGRVSPPTVEPRSPFAFGTGTNSGFALAGNWADSALVEVVLDVPKWATKAIVIGTSDGTVRNTIGRLANFNAFVGAQNSGGGHPQAVEADYFQALNYSYGASINVTPGGSLTVFFAAVGDGGGWPAHTYNFVALYATAIFSSN